MQRWLERALSLSGGGRGGRFYSERVWVTCRNGSSEFLGFFGKSNVRFCVERTLERAKRPDACIAGRSRYAFQSLLYMFLLVRAILARYFLKNGFKVRLSHICTLPKMGRRSEIASEQPGGYVEAIPGVPLAFYLVADSKVLSCVHPRW